eukprot:1844077-Prorocentrum_lima.AAC.1
MMHRELLLYPESGVYLFLSYLRPHVVTGTQTIYLYRMVQFRRIRRGRTDMQIWLTRFALLKTSCGSLE